MDISKIKLGNTVYNIKDETARASITNGTHFIGILKTNSSVSGAATDIKDGDSPSIIETSKGVYVKETPTSGLTKLAAGDIVMVSGSPAKEFIWDGDTTYPKFQELGSTGSLKSLAFKDSATGSVTAAGSNASSSVSLTGGSTSKLVTTSITGTNGTESVSKVTKTSKKLATTSITPTNGTETVSKVTKATKKLATTSIKGVSGTSTVHDTPTLNTTTIYGCGDNANIGSASNWNAGSASTWSFAIDGSDAEMLVISGSNGTVPSLDVTPKTVATKASSGTSVGTSLTAGTEKTFATAASSNTIVATGSLADTDTNGAEVVSSVTVSDKTVAKAGSAITVATGALADTDTNGGEVVATVSISNKTVAKAASSATTVATGSVDANGGGATVATALHTGGTAAAQTFTGSAVSVTVS